MKHKRTNGNTSKAGGNVIKSVSIPNDLAEKVNVVISQNPEMDFSKYVRGLIRSNLEPQKS